MLGMFINHYGAYIADRTSGGWARRIMLFTYGRAMPLFVVLSGAGFVLLCRQPLPVRRVLPRAALLLVAGLWLEGGLVAVILHFYALYLVVGLAVRALPRWTLLPLAVVVTAVGAWIQLYELQHFHVLYKITDDSWWSALPVLGHPRVLLTVLAFTGEYPLLPSFAFFLVGMWVAGTDLRRLRVQAGLVATGIALSVLALSIGWNTQDRRRGLAPTSHSAWKLLSVVGHSQMPGWMVAATGVSLIAIGVACWLSTRLPAGCRPFAYAGQLALSFYVIHVFLLRRGWRNWPWGLSPWQMLSAIAALFAAFVVAATVWRRVFRRGPFEALLRVFDPRPAERVPVPV